MGNVANGRLTAPKTASRTIVRRKLVDEVLDSQQMLVYIQAGAGYGKTTLLSQIAASYKNAVWFSLDHEDEIFTFINSFSEAISRTFPSFSFTASEYLPLEGQEHFITTLANAFLNSLEKLTKDFIIILDDLHTITSAPIRNLIICVMKYLPQNIRLCLSSREAPWPELISLRLKDCLFELTQNELKFTQDEADQYLGFDDERIYSVTEGWPLAISSFRMLWESGVSLADIPVSGHEALHVYLLNECLSNLPKEIINFLNTTANFEELDANMLNSVLGVKNARPILENLASRNIFTIKTSAGLYRYHALFREYLLKNTIPSQKIRLQSQASSYYFNQQDYSRAARYAVLAKDQSLLRKIILASYRDYLKSGRFSELRGWFQALDRTGVKTDRELLVAQGAFLSSIGNFNAAKQCLDTVIPQLSRDNFDLYIEAMLHKARVLRNFVSFEASNQLLDKLLADIDSPGEALYLVAIEKIYNLCWNSQVQEAHAITTHLIEKYARAGNLRIRAWFERYLTAVHFFAGRMKDAVYYYEKSLELPEAERQYLDMHDIAVYAAKAYQMMGERDKAVALITAELQKLRSAGRYEEMWSAYLFAAEIHFQNTYIDRVNGASPSYEKVIKYFTLADEFAPLYRTTEFQMLWAKLHRLVNSLYFSSHNDPAVITEIFANFDQAGDYLKTIVLGRLFGYYASIDDLPAAVRYAQLSIDIGEKSGIMMIPTIAYGVLALAAISKQEDPQALSLTRRFLELCAQNGSYDFFRLKGRYGVILQFALEHDIEPDFARQMMRFADYRGKKIYIETLGGFTVFPYQDRQTPLKMRTKKERELLAFLLDADGPGATKEQIYNAIWAESASDDIKKLIGVNLAQLKNDLAGLGVTNPIINQAKHYHICKEEIASDLELFEAAVQALELQPSEAAAHQIIALYKGEYLAEFEAFWAIPKRIKYREAYEKALGYIKVTPPEN
jgi:LuxR family maltose regulon positive regulatory protein